MSKNIKLNQFGSVMTYAIKLEDLLADYYAIAAKNDDSNQSEFATRSKASLKRKKNLERSRRENVTEITLEPIEGLETENYVFETTKMDYGTINNNEKIIIRFYADAGPKLNVLESKRLFKRYHKEHINLNNLE